MDIDESWTVYIYAALDDSDRFLTRSNAITMKYTVSSTCSGKTNGQCNSAPGCDYSTPKGACEDKIC
jgi:hypothetical protein